MCLAIVSQNIIWLAHLEIPKKGSQGRVWIFCIYFFSFGRGWYVPKNGSAQNREIFDQCQKDGASCKLIVLIQDLVFSPYVISVPPTWKRIDVNSRSWCGKKNKDSFRVFEAFLTKWWCQIFGCPLHFFSLQTWKLLCSYVYLRYWPEIANQ